MTKLRRRGATIAALFLSAHAAPALAAKGFVLNAFSSESLGIAGADVAVARDSAAVNTNPAGLTQIEGHAWDAFLYSYDAFGIRHKDSLGNDAGLDAPAGAVAAGSYAQRLAWLPEVVLGGGFFAEGGTGLGYSSLLTDYGNRDDLASNAGIFKFAGGFGWKVNEQLSVGATLGISVGTGRQKLFPETSDNSDPAKPFFGLRFDGGKTYTPNFTVGLQYHPAPAWTLAASYTSKTPLPLTGGNATVNYDAIGLGRVRYKKARVNGFALPQEVNAGVSWQATPRWLLAAEVDWLGYSGALRASQFLASDPENPSDLPAALQRLDFSTPLNWRDQYLFAAGAIYTLDDKTMLRGGFNIENSPITDSGATPTLNLGQKGEITAGFGRRFGKTWSLDCAFEYQVKVSQTYYNPALPLGTRSKDTYADLGATISISRRW